MNNFKWDARYLYAGVTALLVIFCCIIFYMLFQRWEIIGEAISGFFTILTPFIWGLVFAYLLSPALKLTQTLWLSFFSKKFSFKEKTTFALARGFAVFSSVCAMILIIVFIISLIWPRLEESLISVVNQIPQYFTSINNWLLEIIERFPELGIDVTVVVEELRSYVDNLITNIIQPQVTELVGVLSSSVFTVLTMFLNIVLGIIISCYLLYNKEKFGGQFKRLMYSIFSSDHVDSIYSTFKFINKVFMGFIGGKILDSFIIAILCYIGCAILRMPYAPLIAVIVGITNIIPYFGPFIGAIPSAFIILMESPVQALIFLVFILALQQFDGNILGPRILGNSVGISGFWVMFSILVGSGLFGFTGMLIGVPFFVVLSTGINILIKGQLRKKGLPTGTSEYVCIDRIDPVTKKPVRQENIEIPEEFIEEL